MFAFCEVDSWVFGGDAVHKGHLYKVMGWVDAGFYPYGVVIADRNGNELQGAFPLQLFTYFPHYFN